MLKDPNTRQKEGAVINLVLGEKVSPLTLDEAERERGGLNRECSDLGRSKEFA